MNTSPATRDAFKALGIDANRIESGLYQGAAPPPRHAVRRGGFDVLVFCAQEIQPPAKKYYDVEVLYCPLDDDPDEHPMTNEEWLRALHVAGRVSRRWRAGKRVLVTCAAGRNRSGLVMALALYLSTPKSGESIVGQIRASRFHWSGPALTNPDFVRALEALP